MMKSVLLRKVVNDFFSASSFELDSILKDGTDGVSLYPEGVGARNRVRPQTH